MSFESALKTNIDALRILESRGIESAMRVSNDPAIQAFVQTKIDSDINAEVRSLMNRLSRINLPELTHYS